MQETPDERQRRRRSRRWKRHARILAPFLGVPLLLFTLLVSLDFIEYRSLEEPDRLTDRPIRMRQVTAARQVQRLSLSGDTLIGRQISSGSDETDETDHESIDLELTPPPAHSLHPPTPPYALRQQR